MVCDYESERGIFGPQEGEVFPPIQTVEKQIGGGTMVYVLGLFFREGLPGEKGVRTRLQE